MLYTKTINCFVLHSGVKKEKKLLLLLGQSVGFIWSISATDAMDAGLIWLLLSAVKITQIYFLFAFDFSLHC